MKCTETNVYVTQKGNLLFWPVKNMHGQWIFFYQSASPLGRWVKKLISDNDASHAQLLCCIINFEAKNGFQFASKWHLPDLSVVFHSANS